MKKGFIRISMMLLLFVFAGNIIYSQEVTKTFKYKENVSVKLVSGDCFVSKSNSGDIKVRVVFTYSKEDYTPEFDEGSSTLSMTEKFESGHSSGSSKWYIELPDKTNLEFSTASGDLKAEYLGGNLSAKTASGKLNLKNVNGDAKVSTASGEIQAENIKGTASLHTASGDIAIKNCGGEITGKTASGDIQAENLNKKVELSTASGDIEIKKADGEFKLSCASGNIQAEGVSVSGVSKFSTASGSVYVKLTKSAEYDMSLSSASGNVKLDYNGNQIAGYFEFTANADRGSISCPVKFDKEEKFEKHGQDYMKKSFTKGKDKPVIKINTASGEAALKE
jgi:DUF4097 and DUF4098 domain-containing protein YvlB